MRGARAALLLVLAGAACDDEPGVAAAPGGGSAPASGDPATAASGATVPLTAWVDQMLGDENEPDTVDDKIGVVIDTDDEAAFDKLFR